MRCDGMDNGWRFRRVPPLMVLEWRSSSIAFPHHKIDRAEDRHDVTNHVTWKQMRQHTQVHKRRRTNPHQIPIVAIAFRTNRHIKFELIINKVRMRLPQIEIDTAAAQVWSCDAVINCVLPIQDAYALSAIHKNSIACQQLLRLVKIDSDF